MIANNISPMLQMPNASATSTFSVTSSLRRPKSAAKPKLTVKKHQQREQEKF